MRELFRAFLWPLAFVGLAVLLVLVLCSLWTRTAALEQFVARQAALNQAHAEFVGQVAEQGAEQMVYNRAMLQELRTAGKARGRALARPRP